MNRCLGMLLPMWWVHHRDPPSVDAEVWDMELFSSLWHLRHKHKHPDVHA